MQEHKKITKVFALRELLAYSSGHGKRTPRGETGEKIMSIDDAEFLGWDAAWNGKQAPTNPKDWEDYPELLAAWHRGWQQYQDWQ